MFWPCLVTALPLLFLIILFGGGSLLSRKNIDMDGTPPINRLVFVSSKYLIVVVWVAMVINIWGIDLSFFNPPGFLKPVSIAFWLFGFSCLLIGRFSMGDSFRIGSPKESTGLKMNGIFRLSRNPMYLGVYSSILAPVIITLNPLLLAIAAFIIIVHHKIILAEEEYLKKIFGEEYLAYSARVRRYF